jgi:hypothetical protein
VLHSDVTVLIQYLVTQDRHRRTGGTLLLLQQNSDKTIIVITVAVAVTPARAGSLDKDEIAPFNPAN